MSSQARTLGDAETRTGRVLGVPDPQAALCADLIEAMIRDTPSVAHMTAVIHAGLRDCAGLLCSSVYTLDSEDGLLERVGGLGEPEADHTVLAGSVFRTPAGGPPLRNAGRLALRLRVGGQTVGALVLGGTALEVIRPDAITGIALALASTVASLAAESSRQFITRAGDIIRNLFEKGTAAGSVEAAGELLARITAEAFATEHAGIYLVDAHGRVNYTSGLSLSPDANADLRDRQFGQVAHNSPAWRAIEAAGGPLLVDDVGLSPMHPGGFVQTLGLRSYIIMPLMSAGGVVGMVVCGDTRSRHWARTDRILAGQLAVEGALIVESARLRDAEAQHVAELTRRAYHDALTGLPNRSQLMLTADRAVAGAIPAGKRTALLLLDLDGFKGVNDRVGHHAGDELLQQVSERLLATVRDDDMVARIGGDEFAILLTHDPDGRAATGTAARIHRRLSEPYLIDGTDVVIGASIGVALCPDDATDVTTLLRGADAAMYRAKRLGGGYRVVDAAA